MLVVAACLRRETAMGAVTSDREDFIPSNMDELARHYYGFIIGMVRKLGIPDQEAQDSAQYILERLEKTGAIGQFDPGHLTEHQGKSGEDQVLHVPRGQGHEVLPRGARPSAEAGRARTAARGRPGLPDGRHVRCWTCSVLAPRGTIIPRWTHRSSSLKCASTWQPSRPARPGIPAIWRPCSMSW